MRERRKQLKYTNVTFWAPCPSNGRPVTVSTLVNVRSHLVCSCSLRYFLCLVFFFLILFYF